MPGVYREKECPVCGIKHRKRGNHCSQSCANSTRVTSDETKRKLSRKTMLWKETEDGRLSTKEFAKNIEKHKDNEEKRSKGEYVLQEDDWYVVPGGSDTHDFRDDDDWQEVGEW